MFYIFYDAFITTYILIYFDLNKKNRIEIDILGFAIIIILS